MFCNIILPLCVRYASLYQKSKHENLFRIYYMYSIDTLMIYEFYCNFGVLNKINSVNKLSQELLIVLVYAI